MATPVVLVAVGAMPAIESELGVPVTSVASNGTPVTLSHSGGMAVVILDTSGSPLNLVVVRLDHGD